MKVQITIVVKSTTKMKIWKRSWWFWKLFTLILLLPQNQWFPEADRLLGKTQITTQITACHGSLEIFTIVANSGRVSKKLKLKNQIKKIDSIQNRHKLQNRELQKPSKIASKKQDSFPTGKFQIKVEVNVHNLDVKKRLNLKYKDLKPFPTDTATFAVQNSTF